MAERLLPEFHLLDLWRVLVKRRWMVYTSIAVLVTIVTLGSFLQRPLFSASTRLQIERNAPNVLPFQEVAVIGSDHQDEFFKTQHGLIRSRHVAREVIASLDLAQHDDVQVALPRKAGRGLTREQEAEAQTVDRFLEMLTVAPVRNSRLVDIQFSSHDPVLCARVANRVAETFIAFNAENQYNTSARATTSLSLQIANLQEYIDIKEKELQEYARENEIIPLSGHRNITLKKLEELNNSFIRAQAARIEREAQYVALTESDIGELREVVQGTLIQGLTTQLVELERRRSQLSQKVQSGWPEMIRLERAIDETTRQIDVERKAIQRQVLGTAESVFRAAKSEEDQLRTALEQQTRRVQNLSLKEIRYNNLKSDIANRRQTLEALVKREAETSTSAGIDEPAMSNVRIVDPAEVPARPTSPNLALNVSLSLLLGLGIGMALALSFDYLDRSIKTPEEMEQAVGVPLLSLIPFQDPGVARIRAVGESPPGRDPRVELTSHEQPHSKVAEAFRSMRTALLVSQPGGPPRTILVTSSGAADGKTFVSLNLAISLAQIGKRVLLLDADMRKSRLHKLLNTFNDQGFSSLLSTSGPIAVKPFPTMVEGLDLLPAGPHPPNPADLLDSTRFADILDAFLRQGYDHIVIDSPPVLAVADPTITAGKVEGVLLVARAGITNRDGLRHAGERLQQVKAQIIGSVLNGADLAGRGYYQYTYQYGNAVEPGVAQHGRVAS